MFRPFLSIDIETTGLVDQNPDLLELCMIFDDQGYKGGVVKTLHLYIDHGKKKLNWSEEAKEVNQELVAKIKEIKKSEDAGKLADKDKKVVSLEEARQRVRKFIGSVVGLNDGYPLSIAGRHAGLVTYPILKQHGLIVEGMCHRTIDVPSLFFLEFEYVPTLNQIMKKYKIENDGSCKSDAQAINQLVRMKVDKTLGL